jgi:two-component system, OmpR family, sensor histidine kinase VicK
MTDSGTGIDSDILPRLFFKVCLKILSRCWIGVFISKNIIESHDGNIWAKNNTEDEGDKGATFAFTIPLIEHKVADDDLGMQINQQQT